MCLFHFSTCFEQPSAHHQENQLYQYTIWYISLCVGGSLVCRSLTCIPDCHLHRVIHTRLCIDTVGTPTWHHILFLCLHTYPHTNPDNGRLTVTVAHPCSLHLCLHANTVALFSAPSSRTNSAGHTYPTTPTTLWQSRLANGNLHKKRPPFRPKFIQRSHQEESTSR